MEILCGYCMGFRRYNLVYRRFASGCEVLIGFVYGFFKGLLDAIQGFLKRFCRARKGFGFRGLGLLDGLGLIRCKMEFRA